MAGGVWSPTESKERPGFYMNFVAAALASIQAGARGVVAIPVRANWGPAKQFAEITSEAELIETYGTDTTAGFSAYDCIRLALLGSAKKVLGYRLIDSSAAKATITLKDTAGTPANVLKLDTKYETTRAFKVTTRINPADSTRQDILLYEGSSLLRTFTFVSGDTVGIDNAVAGINNDTGNKWLVASKVAAGSGTLATVSSQSLTGGDAGVSGIINSDYITAQAAFEARKWNVFVLDGVAEGPLQTSTASWIKRLREEGMVVTTVFGGTALADADPAQGNSRSLEFNHEGIVNVIISGTLNGVTCPSAQVACWAAGLIAGQKLSESPTYALAPFQDVSPRLTNSQVIAALQSGSLVLVHDGEKVKIERGVNTLTSLREGQNNSWKKIRSIRITDAINDDLLMTTSDNYIGKVINDDDGKAALLSAYKNYMDTLVNGRLIEKDYTVSLNPKYHPALAAADEVYPLWEATVTDTVEKIFGTLVVR